MDQSSTERPKSIKQCRDASHSSSRRRIAVLGRQALGQEPTLVIIDVLEKSARSMCKSSASHGSQPEDVQGRTIQHKQYLNKNIRQ
jgi:hypothetical protein